MKTYLYCKYLVASLQANVSTLDLNDIIPMAACIILATMVVYLKLFRK